MIKTKIKYLILTLILLLIPNINVSAAYVDVDGIYFNNQSLITTKYISATASSNTFKFTSQTSGNVSYYRFILCMDTKVNTWSDNLSELTDVNFIYTNNSCSYYNSSYTGGKITYLLATYTPGASASFTATITFNAASNFSLQLINASASETPFNIDTSQDYSDVLVDLKKEQEKTQETIKETFEDCTNYIPKYVKTLSDVFIQSNGTELLSDSDGLSVLVYEVPKIGIEYSFKLTSGNRLRVSSSNTLYSAATTDTLSKVLLSDSPTVGNTYKITPNQRYIYLYLSNTSDSVGSVTFNSIKFCSNKIDKTNDKLDEAENTRKGIWETIKSIPGTIGGFFTDLGNKIGNFFTNLLNGIIQGLKDLFIPGEDFFSDWFTSFKAYVELKLGFLATPVTIFIDFIETYSNLSSSNDIVINVPDITVPNFESSKIISATTFNWSQTLKSKTSLNNLWQLYLDFIDVYLILNFLALCERTYNRIFGGDTSNYEYYTTEDSYNVDSDTGEVLGQRHSERTTRRKKVDS